MEVSRPNDIRSQSLQQIRKEVMGIVGFDVWAADEGMKPCRTLKPLEVREWG